jgi:hypothetical protein
MPIATVLQNTTNNALQGAGGKSIAKPTAATPADDYPDSDCSWEVDTRVMPAVKTRTVDTSYSVPAELCDGPDEPYDKDEEMDHTGFWRDGDTQQLMLAVNYYRDRLKGKFEGSFGGKEKRDAAWLKVAGKCFYLPFDSNHSNALYYDNHYITMTTPQELSRLYNLFFTNNKERPNYCEG